MWGVSSSVCGSGGVVGDGENIYNIENDDHDVIGESPASEESESVASTSGDNESGFVMSSDVGDTVVVTHSQSSLSTSIIIIDSLSLQCCTTMFSYNYSDCFW